MAEFTPTPERELTDSPHSGGDAVMKDAAATPPVNGERTSASPRSPKRTAATSNEDDLPVEGEDDGGLFGSGSEVEDESSSPRGKRRRLDDRDIDSGDDEGRYDRADREVEEEIIEEEREIQTAAIELPQHEAPKGSDGEVYLLRYPTYASIEPKAFIPQSFQVPTTAHHGIPPSANFSAAQTANTTIRWRRNPDNPAEIQSNARIIRWSDGSLTLQIASNPLEQLLLPGKPLAPPQRSPAKPTPTSINGSAMKGAPTYDPRQESHTYLAAAVAPPFAKLAAHLTTSLSVQSTTTMLDNLNDEALARLQESMAAEKGDTTLSGKGRIIDMREDPEKAKRQAELAEREKARAERRRANQAERERDRAGRVFGSRAPGARQAGLTVGGLEDDELGMGVGRAPRGPRKSGAKPRRRRGSEYSEDEEEGYGGGRGRQDEYDLEDDFVAASDEEIEVEADEEEEEDFGEDAEPEADAKPASNKQAVNDGDNTGEGAEDDVAAGGNRRRRRVVDEDEDED